MFGFRLFLVAAYVVAASSIVLEVPGYGTIRGGHGISTHTSRRYEAFRGLYYAKQPTNLTRFLPPVPVDPFPPSETIDGYTPHNGCSQSLIQGTENCLIVNVYSAKVPGNASDPDTKYDNLLPVIYWIHGGAFSSGGNFMYFPGKYMEEDVVFVEVQYRLGPLGFLSLNTDEIPGNAGIFDQIEGLRWVQKFIKYFGGDPNCVTIVGESAGSASVSLLLLAPQAKGLFHRAIGESGSVLAGWALDREPEDSEKPSRRIAELAGCPLEPYELLLNCLRNVPAKNLVSAYSKYYKEDQFNGGMGFGGSNPIIQVAGAQRIIEQDPRVIMESGNYSKDIPVMFGANKQEGVLVLTKIYNDFLKPHKYQTNYEFMKNQCVPQLLKTARISDDTGALADYFTKKYLSKAEMGNFTSMTPGLIDMCSVLFMKSPGYETVRLHSKNNPNSYWYSFEYAGKSLAFFLFFGQWPPFPHGVNHADELLYLFDIYPLNKTEKVLSQRMVKVWTTFAKYGNPTPDGVPMMEGIPKFQPYNEKDESYMSINHDWTVQHDYTKQYTVTADSQSDAQIKNDGKNPLIDGLRNSAMRRSMD